MESGPISAAERRSRAVSSPGRQLKLEFIKLSKDYRRLMELIEKSEPELVAEISPSLTPRSDFVVTNPNQVEGPRVSPRAASRAETGQLLAIWPPIRRDEGWQLQQLRAECAELMRKHREDQHNMEAIERGISIRQFVAHGHALAAGTLDENGLKDGEDLLAVLGSAQLVASRHCDDFALIKADGTVHAWGRWRIDGPFQRPGGRSVCSRKLVDVQHITANKAAVAAIVSNGGNSYTVAAQLFQIQEVVATIHAFAARRADGKVISWGWPNYGGDSEEVQEQLVNVQSVTASKYSFAALKSDGTVVTWGEGACGGDSSAVQEELQERRPALHWDIHQICASRNAFSAVKHDGTLVTWGKLAGVVPPALPHHCCELVASDGAFAACLAEGSVVAWGDPRYGGAPTATTAAELRRLAESPAPCCAFTPEPRTAAPLPRPRGERGAAGEFRGARPMEDACRHTSAGRVPTVCEAPVQSQRILPPAFGGAKRSERTTLTKGCVVLTPNSLQPAAIPSRVAKEEEGDAEPVDESQAAKDQREEPLRPEQLTPEQRRAAERALGGENLFLTGAAGTGKSFLLRYLIQELEQRFPEQVAVTASTGVAASHLAGQTLHSFAGFGVETAPVKALKKVKQQSAAVKRWEETRVLIIETRQHGGERPVYSDVRVAFGAMPST
eukprot:g22085.t1